MSGLMLFEFLAEARIEQAIAQGMLDNLPGAGQPLVLADGRLVPEGLRVAYRILVYSKRLTTRVGAVLKARLVARGLRRNRRSTASGRRPGRLGNGALES